MDNTTNDTRECLPYDRSVLDVLDYIFEDTTMTSAFWILTFITMLLVFAFVENVNFVVQKIPNKDRMIRILWILGIYPLFALTSLLSLYFPRSAVFCNLTATCYYALGIYFFMGLIVFYFGGYEQAIHKIADTQVSVFCCKKPTIKLTEWAILRLRGCVIQFAMIRALLMFIENVLFVNGTYSPSQMTTANGSIIIYSLVLASGGIFTAALYMVHNAAKPLLKGFYLSTKCLILFVGFLISDVQMVTIGLLTTNGVMPCVSLCDSANRANCWYSFFQIIESAIMYPIVMMYFRTRKGNVVSLVDMVKKSTPRWKKPLLKKGPSSRSLYNSYTNM
ncbi:organic solute transporter subunit alpha-like [Asterias amurensis]|uniref:organic solute transporter subunit alpha-like n=1 Tax=Asterias amurensis TaxID=7602 RepID=UPI003AB11FEA